MSLVILYPNGQVLAVVPFYDPGSGLTEWNGHVTVDSGPISGPTELLSAVTTGTSTPIRAAGAGNKLTVVIQGNGVITGGVIAIEESYSAGAPYANTWSNIISLTGAADFSTDTQTIYHSPSPAAFWDVRVRIVSAITGGGTVTVTAWIN